MVKKKPEEKWFNIPLEKLLKLSYMPPEKQIGMEIELEGAYLYKSPTKWWSASKDDSLRKYKDTHDPMEYILREPISRNNLDIALDYLIKRLTREKTYVHLSERTSVHVHLNVSNWTMVQVFTLITLYTILEGVIINWCGEHRVGNLFCLRMMDAQAYVKRLNHIISHGHYNDLQSDDLRYSACNVTSLSKYGSLEFRSLRGTIDKKIITTWVDILLRLMEVSLAFDNPQEVIHTFQHSGPAHFFTTCLGELESLFSADKSMNDKLWYGSRLAREIAFATDWKKTKRLRKEKK